MSQMIHAGIARLGSALQNLGSHVDYDVLSLPGGSVIAVVLAVYGSARDSICRAADEPRQSDLR